MHEMLTNTLISGEQFQQMKHYQSLEDTEFPSVTGRFLSQRDGKEDIWCFFVVSLKQLLNKHPVDL